MSALSYRSSTTLWRRWTIATAIGELGGFAVPALVGVLATVLALSDMQRFLPLVIAGAGEGAALGIAQVYVLRHVLDQHDRRRWIGFTALAAALAWALGLLPSMLGNIALISVPIRIVSVLVLGSVFLVSIGGAQWLVLRHYVGHAGWWIAINALAWPLGVAVPVLSLSLIPDDSSPLVMTITGLLSGLGMGLVVGAITGGVLVRLLRHQRVAQLI